MSRRRTCHIGECGECEDLRWVEHPQRGRMLLCEYHEERVRDLDDGLEDDDDPNGLVESRRR